MAKRGIKPGQFYEVSSEELAELRGKVQTAEPKLEFSDELIAVYAAFKDKVYNPQSVLYPSCGFDASPSRVFGNVTFVDSEIKGNQGCTAKLQEAGLQAIKQDIRDYSPKGLHDLLILMNPSIPTEWASRHLKSGGYIISNDYHGNASEMFGQPDNFELWGAIDFAEKDRRKGDNRIVISRNLEDMFQPVANEEELKRFRPGHYEFIEGMFQMYAMNSTSGFSADKPFEEMWANYREMMKEGMPYKRVANEYIFVKK